MKTSTRLSAALLLLFLSLSAKATSIAGGHISYRAIDSVTYVVTAQIFAECDSVNPNVGDSLIVSWSGGSYSTAMTLLSVTDVTGSFNKCTVGSGCFTGIAKKIYEHRFTDTVDISQANGCTITFAYAKGKRSAFITTGPAGTDFYIYSTLNRCNGLNNSAHITLPPQFYIAVGQDAILSTGYIDTINGDSLRFNLVSAKTSAVSDASYSGSWSPVSPITFLGFPNTGLNFPAGLHFDSITSQLSFRPTVQNQIAVLTFEAIEYNRVNGVMVEKGRTRLEHTVQVYSSPNNKVPRVSNQLIRNICAGQQFCHTFFPTDADAKDTLSYIFNNGIPKGTLTIDTGKWKRATFCWTPTDADIRNWPHLFTITLKDDACSPNGVISHTAALYVKPALDTTLLETDTVKVNCNKITVIMKKKVPQGINRIVNFQAQGKYMQTSGDTVIFAAKDTGWIKIMLYVANNSCFKQFFDSVYVNPPYKINLSPRPDTTVCPNTTVVLSTTPLNGSAPYLYFWDPFNFRTQTISMNLTTIPRTLFITVVDSLGCTGYDTVLVRVHSLQKVRFGKPDSLCTNDNPHALPVIPAGGQFTGKGIGNGTIFYPDSAGEGFYNLQYTANDSNGCRVTGIKTMRVLNAPSPQFTTNTIIGGAPLSVNFVDQTIGNITNRTWIFTRADGLITDTITSTSSTITKVFNDTGKYHVTLINYSGICDAVITKNNYITVHSTVGINNPGGFSYTVYPNPAKDAVIVEGNTIHRVELTDIHGKVIPAVIEKSAGLYRVLSPGSSGVYILQITNSENLTTAVKVIFIE